MRLVFLYTIDGQAPTNSKLPWCPGEPSLNRFANGLTTEGYFWLLKRMVEAGIVDECLIFVESTRSPGHVRYNENMVCYVVPELAYAREFLRDRDVIFCRGGFRTWFPFLEKASEEKRWLLCYAANTGRERWRFWDVVFDDLAGENFIDGVGRVHLDFRKPTNPELFKPVKCERPYDLCIGASHIHDKKGQWRGIKAAVEYEKLFGRKLKCVMPGAIRRGVITNGITGDIKQRGLDVTMPGMLPRAEVARVMNSSKVFAHLGSGGQGDRGPLEAMRCGTPLIIGFPRYHAPFVSANPAVTLVAGDPDDPANVAREIHDVLGRSTEEMRQEVFEYHESQCGIEEIIIPRMKKLFSMLEKQKIADRRILYEWAKN